MQVFFSFKFTPSSKVKTIYVASPNVIRCILHKQRKYILKNYQESGVMLPITISKRPCCRMSQICIYTFLYVKFYFYYALRTQYLQFDIVFLLLTTGHMYALNNSLVFHTKNFFTLLRRLPTSNTLCTQELL